MRLTAFIVGFLCVAPLAAQAPDTPDIPELSVRPPELLPPFRDTVSARQRLFEELDRMNGQELLRIHQTISYINRFPAADDFLSEPPQLPLVRSELESFVATGDDLRIARLYELFKLQREHQRQEFLDLLSLGPTDPKVQRVRSAAHSDTPDGSDGWTNRDRRESPPGDYLSRMHALSINAYGLTMMRDLCVTGNHHRGCDEHLHRAYDACIGEAPEQHNFQPHCLAHTNELQRCWTANGWSGCGESPD